MTDYAPDPGGNFESDVHRRVLGVVPVPGEDPKTFEELIAKLDTDPHVPVGTTKEEEVLDVLAELTDSGDISKTKNGYKMTKQGGTNIAAPPEEAA